MQRNSCRGLVCAGWFWIEPLVSIGNPHVIAVAQVAKQEVRARWARRVLNIITPNNLHVWRLELADAAVEFTD